MDDLFNIFGSHGGAVQLTTVDHHVHQVAPLAKGLLTSKSNLAVGTLPKGKKVLSDVGNKIKGLNDKSNNKSDIMKKPLQVNKAITKNNPESQGAKSKNKLNEILENQKSAPLFPLPNPCNEETEWPEVETQGSGFWNDEKCSDLLWPESDWPTLEDFSKTSNIWNNEDQRSYTLTPSPPPSEFQDDLQFCFELPKSSLDLPLEEVTVPFPWEL